ncbi:hypothetical protein Pmani_015068 [Petrolisthes manimaculis]|uniref:Uncharacterized protein n=1 Tax=Petrolisthes manimaculis TaxID=1843537 RepID=A0AAE1PSC5_9EUCA|nr:hypothetical protein Pmani_015068 [Petrolisthes manimaculis]
MTEVPQEKEEEEEMLRMERRERQEEEEEEDEKEEGQRFVEVTLDVEESVADSSEEDDDNGGECSGEHTVEAMLIQIKNFIWNVLIFVIICYLGFSLY